MSAFTFTPNNFLPQPLHTSFADGLSQPDSPSSWFELFTNNDPSATSTDMDDKDAIPRGSTATNSTATTTAHTTQVTNTAASTLTAVTPTALKVNRSLAAKPLETPFLHIPGDPVPPLPVTRIPMYADARLEIARMVSSRLTPMQEIMRMYFQAFHDAEKTGWGGGKSDMSHERERFKSELMEHLGTFVAQVHSLKAFIELGRTEIGAPRTGLFIRGADAIMHHIREEVEIRHTTPLKEEDMLLLHRMVGQYFGVINDLLKISWKFSKEKLCPGGGIETTGYKSL